MKIALLPAVSLTFLLAGPALAVDLTNLKLAMGKLNECDMLLKQPMTANVAKARPEVREAFAKKTGPANLNASDKLVYEHTMRLAQTCIASYAAVDAATKAIPKDKPLEQADMDVVIEADKKVAALHEKLSGLFK